MSVITTLLAVGLLAVASLFSAARPRRRSNEECPRPTEGVSVDLGGAPVLRAVDLHVAAGEFLTLLGPSGSAKSTTLNVLAGFVAHHRGRVLFDGGVVDGVVPERRGIGFAFQSYALFPQMTVGENVAFPLRARRTGRAERLRMMSGALSWCSSAATPIDRFAPSPEASSNWSPWPARWCSNPDCCCWTSRSPPSARACARPCRSSCADPRRGGCHHRRRHP